MLTDLITRHLAQFAATHTKTHGEPPRPDTLAAHRLPLERFAHHVSVLSSDPSRDSSFILHPSSFLSVNLCKDWILALQQTTGQANVNQSLTALTGFLRWLTDEGLWDRDRLTSWETFHKSQYRRVRRSSGRRYLHAEELPLVLGAIANARNSDQAARDVAFFGSIFFGLARPGELMKVNRSDVRYCPPEADSPRSFRILLRAAVTKDHTERVSEIFEGSSIGSVDVFAAFRSYAAWRTSHGPSEPDGAFFIGVRKDAQDRCSRRNWGKIFSRAIKDLKLPAVSPYWLRHAAGEILPTQLSPRDCQQLFGHSDPRTTEGYTNHDNEERLRAARIKAHSALVQSLNQ